MKIEVCINSVESGIEAQKGNAFRVELCDNLYEGGTTPSYGSIILARKYLQIELNVIIRPRGGDFYYTEIEFETMKQDVLFCKQAGVDGVVIGLLKPDGSVDVARTRELVELAHPMNVTFHRAFDMASEPTQALEDVIKTGCNRLLTSGQANKAFDGRFLIQKLVEQAGNRIIIMPGSGITEENIRQMITDTNATEYHVSCRKKHPSLMQFRKTDVFMGGLPDIPEYEIAVTDAERIQKVVTLANSFGV